MRGDGTGAWPLRETRAMPGYMDNVVRFRKRISENFERLALAGSENMGKKSTIKSNASSSIVNKYA
jgi:hypothetical protein